MNTLSRFLVILAVLAGGLWLRGGVDLLSQLGFPFLALLGLGLAVVAAPGGDRGEAKARLGETYARWLEAWHQARRTSGPEPAGRDTELHVATQRLALVAPDRVLKSLLTAERQGLRTDAVAGLIIEMRRSIGRPSLTVRTADLARLLGEPAGEPVGSPPAERDPATAPEWTSDAAPERTDAAPERTSEPAPPPDPVSFLS